MRFARLFLSSAVLSLAVIALPAGQAHACSCMPGDPASAFSDDTMVFRGTVRGIEEDEQSYSKSVAFEIDAVWHGPAMNGLVVNTPLNSAACGVDYVLNEEYTVVANLDKGQWHTFLCGQHFRDPETGDGMSPSDLVADREPLRLNDEQSCVPYVCADGSVHAACTEDGHVINYFAEPCHASGGPVSEDDSPKPSVNQFSDVTFDHPSYEAIEWAREYGVVEGYSDGTFRPSALVNRAEFTKILLEAYGIDTKALCRIALFPDVSLNEWYGAYVQAARCQGIISGYPDGTFRPSATINVAEASKIIAQLDHGETIPPTAGDRWYLVYMDYLDDHEALPQSAKNAASMLTRAQMVEIMYLLQPVLPQEGPLTGVIERMARPADDIAYDFALVLDTPMRDPWSAMGPWAIVRRIPLVYTNGMMFESFDTYVGKHVTVEGEMQWGYAESRVFAAESIEVE